MMVKYLILLILPVITYGHIEIKIKPTKKGDDTSVAFLGEDLADITEKDREIFKIDDETLKRASELFMGKRCSHIYLKPPTPWGDVYKSFGWDVVRKHTKPVKAKVIGVNTKPVAVGSADYVNSHNGIDVTYSTSVTQQVEETVDHTWTQGGELGFGQEIKYEVKLGPETVGGSTSFSYKSSFGESTSKSKTVTLGTTSTILVVVPPNTMVVATLIASRGTVDIEIRYSIEIKGNVFCNYAEEYQGHHFYALPLEHLQFAVRAPQVLHSTEKVSVGFYTSTRLEVSNGTSTR